MSGASSFAATAQQSASGVGVAFGALMLHLAMTIDGNGARPVVADFHLTFAMVGAITLTGLCEFPAAGASRRREVSGHASPRAAR